MAAKAFTPLPLLLLIKLMASAAEPFASCLAISAKELRWSLSHQNSQARESRDRPLIRVGGLAALVVLTDEEKLAVLMLR